MTAVLGLLHVWLPANKLLKGRNADMITIEFDKTRRLHFDLPAIKDLETAMGGLPLGAIVQQLEQAGVNAIVYSLWAGLKHEDAALTPNLITKMLTRHITEGRSLFPIAQGLNDAFEASGLFRGVGENTAQPPAPAGASAKPTRARR